MENQHGGGFDAPVPPQALEIAGGLAESGQLENATHAAMKADTKGRRPITHVPVEFTLHGIRKVPVDVITDAIRENTGHEPISEESEKKRLVETYHRLGEKAAEVLTGMTHSVMNVEIPERTVGGSVTEPEAPITNDEGEQQIGNTDIQAVSEEKTEIQVADSSADAVNPVDIAAVSRTEQVDVDGLAGGVPAPETGTEGNTDVTTVQPSGEALSSEGAGIGGTDAPVDEAPSGPPPVEVPPDASGADVMTTQDAGGAIETTGGTPIPSVIDGTEGASAPTDAATVTATDSDRDTQPEAGKPAEAQNNGGFWGFLKGK